jgi:hypothetical protein
MRLAIEKSLGKDREEIVLEVFQREKVLRCRLLFCSMLLLLSFHRDYKPVVNQVEAGISLPGERQGEGL